MEKLLKTKEDKEQFLTWIAFLQAGVFQQAFNATENTEGAYCIMGTAIVLFVPETRLVIWQDKLGSVRSHFPLLPKWAVDINDHMRTKCTNFYLGTEFDYSLIYLNDMKKKSFKELAEILLLLYEDELDAL